MIKINPEVKTNLKITLGVVLAIVILWYIFNPGAFWGIIAAGSIVLGIILLIRRKIAKEVRIYNVRESGSGEDGTGESGEFYRAGIAPNGPGEHIAEKGTGTEGLSGRAEERGDLQAASDNTAPEAEQGSGEPDEASESDSVTIPDVEQIE